MKTKWIAALAVAAAASGTAVAQATPPDVERWSEDYTSSVDCAAFVDQFTGTEHVSVTTRFDEAGEPTEVVVRIRFRETNFNSVTRKSLPLHGSATERHDLVAGTRTITGAVYIGTDKGGTYIQDAGRVVLDLETDEIIDIAGPHQGLLEGVDALICDALA